MIMGSDQQYGSDKIMTYIIFYIALSSIATNIRMCRSFYGVICLAINIVFHCFYVFNTVLQSSFQI